MQPSSGLGYELDTIAAVVIGGASLSGGVGSIGGTAVGVLIIGVLRNGLNLLGVSPFIQQVIIGVVIALAVAADTWRRRRDNENSPGRPGEDGSVDPKLGTFGRERGVRRRDRIDVSTEENMLTKRSLLLAAAAARAAARPVRHGLGQGGQEARPCRRQSAGRLLQPDQAVGRSLRQGEGHRGHHRRRQGRFGDAGQPGPGPDHAEHRRADLHPGRRHRRDRADQDRQGGRHSGRSMSTATPTARRATPSSPPTASPPPRRSATTSPSRPAARAR